MSSEHSPLLNSSKSTPAPSSTSKRQDSRTQDNLTTFRKAVGINVTPLINDDLESARKGAHGLYKQIISLQRSRALQYRVVDALYYLAIGAQILIGATLASLGPLSKLHPLAITILGIVNTSTGAVLALLKGQGLPDRLRKDEYQMRKVQDFIEEMDVRFAVEGDAVSTGEVRDAVERVFEMYNTARDTAEMNRSGSYAHQTDGADDGQGKTSSSSVVGSNLSTDPNSKGKTAAKFVID